MGLARFVSAAPPETSDTGKLATVLHNQRPGCFLIECSLCLQGSLRVASPVARVWTGRSLTTDCIRAYSRRERTAARSVGAKLTLPWSSAISLALRVSVRWCVGARTGATRCQNKRRIEMGGTYMAAAGAYSLCRLCKSVDQLLRRKHSKGRPVQLVGARLSYGVYRVLA